MAPEALHGPSRLLHEPCDGADAASMREALERMAPIVARAGRGEPLTLADRAACVLRAFRRNVGVARPAAERAVDMLIAKVQGLPFKTELARPSFGHIRPARAVSPETATVALVTTGGIVPSGNPDRLESSTATRYLAYDVAGLERLAPDAFACVHAGFDTTWANADPHRVLPLDVCRALEAEGRIGRLHGRYYVTVGNLTPVAAAERFGRAIAAELRAQGVQAVILTAT